MHCILSLLSNALCSIIIFVCGSEHRPVGLSQTVSSLTIYKSFCAKELNSLCNVFKVLVGCTAR